jgi:PAS domain S-box-containing protein
MRDDQALASGRHSASLLSAIVESSIDAIFSNALDGRLTSWNLGAEQMFGFRADDVIGQHISVLCQPARIVELEEAMQKIANGGRVEQLETQWICKDKTVLDMTITIAPIRDVDGDITGASLIGRDITNRLALERERKGLDARLNQSERLESMGRLAGGIAHDFNNLLSVILNYATFVDEELEDKEAAHSDLAQIRSAAELASQLTSQLLAFARREVHKPRVLSVSAVITNVDKLLDRTVGEQVDLAIPDSPGLWNVKADPGQLELVLINLVVNARDSMPGGGTVTIDAENVDVDDAFSEIHSALAPGRYVRIRVSDTGSGMEQSVLEHIFEPFFTTKADGRGTGLGLPMAFGIVHQSGGDIQFHSEVGVGTTCRIYIPASDQTPSATGPIQAPIVLQGTETVLVVEDEDVLREMTRRILARNGYQVFTCRSGHDAIELVKTYDGEIDVLLTDVIMPQMAGRELADRLQLMQPGLPVLFMSGYAQPVLGSTLGDGDTLLEKPFSEQQLLGELRGAIYSAR